MTREEAINKVRQMSLPKETIEILQALAPELRESEDERVRKTLIEFLTQIKEISESGRTTWAVREEDAEMCKSSIAWLEKQKEPVPIPDKFSGLKSLMLQYLQSAANRKDDSEIESDTDLWGRKILDYVWKYSDEQNEQKPEWSDEDKEALDMCLDAIPKRWKTKSGILLTKWLKDNIHLQSKQEWSEEDEDMIQDIIASIDTCVAASDFHEMETWLKSLRPQPKRDCKDCAMFLNGKCTKPHWKPSKEQMEALRKLMKYAVSLSSYYDIQKEIESLYNDLNKLK